jgi:hypothetical protein
MLELHLRLWTGDTVSDPIRACHDSACVQVLLYDGIVEVRSSTGDPITYDEWLRFLVDVKAGRFDEVADA